MATTQMEGKRTRLERRHNALKTERDSWRAHWSDLSKHMLPRNGRFFIDDRNRGDRRHNNIYDNTATSAVRINAAGFMSLSSSPASQWFRMSTGNPKLNQRHDVKLWLDEVNDILAAILQRSNAYDVLHSMYEERSLFGTACALMLPDFENVIRLYMFTIGQYSISADARGTVNTMFREFQMTVAQLVREFDFTNCSVNVQQMWNHGAHDTWVSVVHAIEPRDEQDRETGRVDNLNMAWKSVYFEFGAPHEKFLREGGFNQFPVLAPRYAVVGEDIYGHSPGMEALGDVRQLQHQQLRKAEAIDFQTKPPMQAPMSLRNREVDMMPGGLTFVDSASPQAGVRNMFETRLDLNHLAQDMNEVRRRIQASFSVDAFLMISNSDDPQKTATEIFERREEKFMVLGPVVSRQAKELHKPLILRTFEIAVEAGLIPPAPVDAQDREIEVEFTSILAQAQRASRITPIDRWVGAMGVISQIPGKEDVVDKLNSDEWADTYSDLVGVPPRLVAGEEQVQALRDARNRAAAAQQQAQVLREAASGVKDLQQAAAAVGEPAPTSAPVDPGSPTDGLAALGL